MKKIRRKKLRRQTPLEGGRIKASAGLDPRIEKCVERDMARFGVTRPLVISVALATMYGIEIDDELG